MGKLDAAERKRIPRKDFALPDKRSKSGAKGGYPIENKAHARDALSRVAQHGSPAEKAEVRAKVHAKFPSIDRAHHRGGAEAHHDGRQHAHKL